MPSRTLPKAWKTLSKARIDVALSLVPMATTTLRAASLATAAPSPSMATVESAYGRLPLSFEVNKGQVDSRV